MFSLLESTFQAWQGFKNIHHPNLGDLRVIRGIP
jgi:hypothetical protein